MSKNSSLIQSSLGKTQIKQNLQNWDTQKLVGESDSQNSKNYEFIIQIFCQSPLFYLWPSSSLCLLLTLKLLHIHVWLFFLRPEEHLHTWYSSRSALPLLSNYQRVDKKHRAVLQLPRASQSTATSNSEQLGQDISNNCHSWFHWCH